MPGWLESLLDPSDYTIANPHNYSTSNPANYHHYPCILLNWFI